MHTEPVLEIGNRTIHQGDLKPPLEQRVERLEHIVGKILELLDAIIATRRVVAGAEVHAIDELDRKVTDLRARIGDRG